MHSKLWRTISPGTCKEPTTWLGLKMKQRNSSMPWQILRSILVQIWCCSPGKEVAYWSQWFKSRTWEASQMSLKTWVRSMRERLKATSYPSPSQWLALVERVEETQVDWAMRPAQQSTHRTLAWIPLTNMAITSIGLSRLLEQLEGKWVWDSIRLVLRHQTFLEPITSSTIPTATTRIRSMKWTSLSVYTGPTMKSSARVRSFTGHPQIFSS